MQTPLIFKLLLLLAVALRLIKTEKKEGAKGGKKYYRLKPDGLCIQKLTTQLTGPDSTAELVKNVYRKKVRKDRKNKPDPDEFAELPFEEQLICIAYQFEKFYKRGGLFRFFWHGNQWIIAFGQSLKYVNTDWYIRYKKLIAEIAFKNPEDFDYQEINWETVYPFPDGQKQYNNLKAFEEVFDLDEFLNKIISTTIYKSNT